MTHRPRRGKSNPRNANGHRRRQAVARVRARDTHCALCGAWVDPDLPYLLPGAHARTCTTPTCPGCLPHPLRGEVDEIIPVTRGGSPYEPSNLTLLHRDCNNWKSNRTLDEARAALRTTRPPAVTAPQRHTRHQAKTSRNW